MSEPFSESLQSTVSPAERYERGLVLKNAGLYKSAIDQFELAKVDPALTLKSYAQIGLCYKIAGRYEDAVAAFQKALSASSGSSKETVQILYVLGRTLEALGRVEDTLECYRWIRREDPGYRDVAGRIERLSSRRPDSAGAKSRTEESTWTGSVLKSWQGLLGAPK
ncbi:MAG TPA: tetratricopeptide repeat protein [Nitrospira sp.]|nr:tetratricopeptide repeat protein [Nitrospira sp.]